MQRLRKAAERVEEHVSETLTYYAFPERGASREQHQPCHPNFDRG